MSSSKNFRYLDFMIHGGENEIILDYDIILADGEESEYLDGIELDVDDIVINGNGHIIDACGKTRIFKITGENIKLKNITFKNGFSQKGGGAIANAGAVSIEDATFAHNNVDGDGGAIYNDMPGKISITNSKFLENKTNEDGGAIFNWGELEIENSIFQENFAKTDASAIHNGGGIHNFSVAQSRSSDGSPSKNNLGHGQLNIIGTQFIKNSAESTGTVVNWNEVKIEDSAFRQNDAKEGSAVLWNYGSHVTFNNVSISDNRSGAKGSIMDNTGEMSLVFSKIHGNEAGTIIDNGKDGGLRIYNCEFLNNRPKESVIENRGKSCLIERGVFDDNASRLISNYSDLIIKGFEIKNSDEIIFNRGHVIIKEMSSDFNNRISPNGTVSCPGEIELMPNKGSYGYIIRTILAKVIEGIILMLIVGFVGFNLGFLGFDQNQLNASISALAPFIGMIFVISVGSFSLNAAKECGGIFTNMSNFKIGAMIALINLVLYLIIANFVFPMVFPANFTPNGFLGINYCIWMGITAIMWYLVIFFALSRVADEL